MGASESELKPGLERLTPRERECLSLVAQHWRTKDIARQLGLSPDTVNEYVGSAVRKLRAEDRFAAARRYRLWAEASAEDVASAGVVGAVPPSAPTPALAPPAPPAAEWSVSGAIAGTLSAAARWALLTAGAMGGVALLLSVFNEAGLAYRDLRYVALLLGALAWPLFLMGCGVAYWKGGTGERLAAAGCLTGYALTVDLYQGPGPDAAIIAIDAGFTVVLAAIAFACRRPWLQLAAGVQLLTALTHVAALSLTNLSQLAYMSVIGFWSYAMLAAVVWSALAHARAGPGTAAAHG